LNAKTGIGKGLAILSLSLATYASSSFMPERQAMASWQTVQQVVKRYGPTVDSQLRAEFSARGLSYPPAQVTLLGLKHEKRLELWARDAGRWQYVKAWPVKAASGIAGPKLKEGDRQVPEGFYRISKFNPNSNFHLSLKLNYPNAFDQLQAKHEGRKNLGGNIFIHGRDRSTGCLAIGDEAIEELFVLIERVGLVNSEVIIAPHDLRNRPVDSANAARLGWVGELYQAIETSMQEFRK